MRVFLALCGLAAASLTAVEAHAATLIESRVGEEVVALVSDPERRRVRIIGAGGIRLIDVAEAAVYLIEPNQMVQKVAVDQLPPVPEAPDGTMVEKLGPGPRVAGYPTTRFRVRVAGTVCSMVDANLGLGHTLAPAHG